MAPSALADMPFDPASTYSRGCVLWGFDQLVADFGGDALAMLAEAGLPADAFNDPDALISFGAFTRLMETAAHRLDRPTFGLEWSRSLPPQFPNLGGLILCAALSPQVSDWLELGLKYWVLHTNGFTAEMVDDGLSSNVSLRSHINPLILYPIRQFAEHALANQVLMTRIVTGIGEENPTVVRFQHYRPRDTSLHEAIFRCPIEFDAPFNEIVFDRKVLSYRTNGNLTLVKPLVNFYVGQRIRRMPVYDQAVTTAVAQAICSVVGTGRCNIEFIAEAMGFNSKKLQRMLAAEQTTFSQVLEDTRRAMARRYLVESNAPISRVAGLLDYAGAPQFTLAFRRWTGTTPLAYRKRERRLVPA
ncbi:MAG: AraC family transcriptional regulator, partial [Beijerinckiaceae bacterium]